MSDSDKLRELDLRELDQWIAEHVFGWTRWNFNNGFTQHNYLEKKGKLRANKYRKRGFKPGLELVNNFPHYSTDTVAAMEVLKACGEKQGYIDKICYAAGYWGLGIFVGKSLEHLICLYAQRVFTRNQLKES